MKVITLITSLLVAAADLGPFHPFQKGVNLDVSTPSDGVWFKSTYDPNQMKAVAEAGFEAVRVFMPYLADTQRTQEQINDALANNLAISVCMWGMGSWASNPTKGKTDIARKWGQLASQWKHYPNKVVFEVLNEPNGIGFAKTDIGNANAMRVVNAAVQAIRDVDSDRPILIGTPGHNDAVYLDPFVTEQYLSYKFDGSKGFTTDPNVGVAIHFYEPREGSNFAMWIQPLGNDDKVWQDPIAEQIRYVVDWQEKVKKAIPVVTTEWGCWIYKERTESSDLARWTDFHLNLFRTHDIGHMGDVGIMLHWQRMYG